LLLSCGSNGYPNTPQFYVVSALPVFFQFVWKTLGVIKFFEKFRAVSSSWKFYSRRNYLKILSLCEIQSLWMYSQKNHLILFWVTLIQQNSVSLNFILVLDPLWVCRCLVQLFGSARPTKQRHIPEDLKFNQHAGENLRFTVFMCFDETLIRLLHTYVFVFIFVSYSVLNVRKANTQFNVREKMIWSADKMFRYLKKPYCWRRWHCSSYFRDRICLNYTLVFKSILCYLN
jgi:hypothetical protein